MALRPGDLKLSSPSLVQLLEERARQHPDGTAYTFLNDGSDPLRITYHGLDRRARAIAAHLIKKAAQGDRVLLLFPPGLDFVAGFFGSLYAGLVSAPLPVAGTRAGLEKIGLVRQDTGARVALTVSALADDLRRGLPGISVAAVDAIDSADGDGFRTPAPDPGSLAYLQYTSGSTSAPRGVMLSHANVLHNLGNIDQGFEHGRESVVVSWLPHFHDMGLIYGLLAPLFHTLPCYLISPATFVQRPFVWLEAITRYKATHSGGPNFAYDLCVRRIPPESRAGLDLSSWEVAFNGAEPVHAETLDRFTAAFSPHGFRRTAFDPAYGLAEASLKVSGGTKREPPVTIAVKSPALALNRAEAAAEGDPDARTLVGCGRAGLDTKVAIVDPEMRVPCELGEVGEIWVAGPGVALGYWNRDEETHETFGARLRDGEGPFLRTGDLGFQLGGELFIAGRIKDLIIIRGLNHHPSDIELTARRAHPEVAFSVSAAFGVDAADDERLVLLLEAGPQSPTDPEEIAAAIRQEIAEKHQVRVYSVALVKKGGIPKTSSGKIQRSLCRSLYLARKLDILYESVAAEAVIDETSASLDREGLLAMPDGTRKSAVAQYMRHRLARLLKQKPSDIDRATPLTAFGIDSLMAMEFQNRVEQDFGICLRPAELFSGSSIDDLASAVVAQVGAGVAAEEPIPVRRATHAPLSFEQERLWLLNRIVPGSPAQHIPFALRIAGPLNHEALEHSLGEVARRQESLRSSFTSAGCTVQASVQLSIPVEDVSNVEAASRRASEETAKPFRLDEAPLFRLQLFRLGSEDHILFLVIHHIIADFLSIKIFFEELFSVYASQLETPLEVLPVQYSDFALWQRDMLKGSKLDSLTAYWRDHLRGATALEIPGSHARPKKPAFYGATEPFAIPVEVVEALRAVCRQEGVTVFAALLAAFEALLARTTGQSDIVIGTTSANRHRLELERVIGFFAAPLPLRVDLQGNPQFREILHLVRREVLDSTAHSALPFSRIIESLSPPLLRVMFSLFKSVIPEVRVPELTFAPLDVDPGATDFDLFVNLIEEDRAIRGAAVYNKSLYDAPTIRKIISAYLDILQTAVATPEKRLSEMAIPDGQRGAQKERPAIAVTATFTAEPIEEVLRFWLIELGFDYRVRFAPYNQVFQQLLDPTGTIGANRNGMNVVLVRIEDWGDDLDDSVSRFVAALNDTTSQSPVPFLVCLCPPSPAFLSKPGNPERHARMEALMVSSLTQVVTPRDIERLYPVSKYYDAHGDRLGHVPYTPEFYAALGTVIARKLHELSTAPFKVISLDCDDTLWNGICGEDGPFGLTIDAPHKHLQEFVLQKRDAGMLLALTTKNNEEDVWAAFEANPDMPLRRRHLTASRINWEPKSTNLRALAAELGVGIESLIHIDDNPAEYTEIQVNCPEAPALQLPVSKDDIPQYLRNVWAFDHVASTDEDRRRASMYGQRLERRKLQQQTATLEEFLTALNLQISIEEARPEQFARISQLTRRTNQMNFTTIRRSEEEVRELINSGEAECLVVDLTDRFGSYGAVGVILFRTKGNDLDVDTFLVSCRALGRGVEHRMIAKLGEIAQARGLTSIILHYNPTAKNRPAADFIATIGAGWAEGPLYRLPAAFASSIGYNPRAKPGEPVAIKPVAAEKAGRTIDYHRIATELDEAGKILAQVRATLHTGAVNTTPYEAPRTPLEKELSAIWEEMLHAPQVGIKDNFFDLGGHSLLAVQLLSRVREVYDIDLPLDVVFTGNFCVAELAQAIEIQEIEEAGAEEYSELLKEIEGLSDEEVRALLEQELRDSS